MIEEQLYLMEDIGLLILLLIRRTKMCLIPKQYNLLYVWYKIHQFQAYIQEANKLFLILAYIL